MNLISKLHLSKFKIGDVVEIISMPKYKRSETNGFKGLICEIEKIELKEKFTNGIGSVMLKILDGGVIIATGILSKNVKFKHAKKYERPRNK